ncbi:hypothetical protein KIW84_071986 [Lathyrus oleraceus]|uniref:Uncharacterized protein n=1 Tax=Pisum sativum TaxID=3888 RepID=A0A9D4VM75_PEA|nr:hypothetical protein KIW84_071986 [Pisum sativum]
MVAEDEMLTNDLDSGSEPSMDTLVSVVSVLPRELDQITEEQNAFFERPDEAIQSHLKPLFISRKIEDVPINKILVDCGATVNLMPHHILRKIGKYDTNAKPPQHGAFQLRRKGGYYPWSNLGRVNSGNCHQTNNVYDYGDKCQLTCYLDANGYMDLELYYHPCTKESSYGAPTVLWRT